MFHELNILLNMTKQEIIEQGYLYLEREFGDRFKRAQYLHQGEGKECDATMSVDDLNFVVVARNEIRPNELERLLEFTRHKGDVLVIASYITPKAKSALRKYAFSYVDRVGNMYFRKGAIHIHIEGIRNQPPTEDYKNRAFTPTGIKVVFQLLINKALVNATYRSMAAVAGVALGTLPKVMEGLREEGFIVKQTKQEWVVVEPDKLLKRWVEEYGRRLKPKLLLKRYRSVSPNFDTDWSKLGLADGAQWGGEPAGDLLTNYLIPEQFTLYTNQSQAAIMRTYKWLPDPEGNIYVYRKFWEVSPDNSLDKQVHAILVYADLLATGDSRCIETAKRVYEQYL